MITYEEVKKYIREDISKNDYLILTTKCYEMGITTIEDLVEWRQNQEIHIVMIIHREEEEE